MKTYKIGIRLEDKPFEGRVPLIPHDVQELLSETHPGLIKIYVQESREQEKIVTFYDIDDLGNQVKMEITQVPRCFTDKEYKDAGAEVVDKLPDDCNVIIGIKEVRHRDYLDENNKVIIKNGFAEGKTYVFFSHTYKYQSYNRKMFEEVIEKKCTLIDYEMLIANLSRTEYESALQSQILLKPDQPAIEPILGYRTVFFGKHAGIVGAFNSLSALSQKLDNERIITPFAKLKTVYNLLKERPAQNSAIDYSKETHRQNFPDYTYVCDKIKEIDSVLTASNCPLPIIIGVAGKSSRQSIPNNIKLGRCATGVREILKKFERNYVEITPQDLLNEDFRLENGKIYAVYLSREETSENEFPKYLPKLTIFLNTIKWDKSKSRIVTRELAKKIYSLEGMKTNRLRVIGDITCDPGGSIEMSVDVYSDKPYYIYEPEKDNDNTLKWYDDKNPENNMRNELFLKTCNPKSFEGIGPIIMSVTNLPCELPRESSRKFSLLLSPYIYDIARLDSPETFEKLDVSRPVKRAIMVYKGIVTKDWEYINENYLEQRREAVRKKLDTK